MNEVQLLKGKNVVITGCARGIGAEIMEVFAAHGANIWACVRKQTTEFDNMVTQLSLKHQITITPLYFDLENKEDMKIAVKQIMSSKLPVDILVNNAGITYNALYQMSDNDNIEKVLNVNFTTQLLFTQYLVKLMVRKNSGTIINISSSAGLDGNAGRAVYGASKAAVICSTKALAEELGSYGIRANSIAPGITQTDMLSSMTDEVVNETVMATDMKRAGKPVDIANAVLFLASDLSTYITGQVIRVDGGM